MNSIFRILLYGIQGFRRNIWLSIIAIITMTLTVTTMTIFALGNIVASKKYQEFNSRIDYNIFLNDGPSEDNVSQFRAQVAAQPQISSVQYLSKEDVRNRFETLFASEDSLKGLFTPDNNPLLREIDVKFKDPTQIEKFNSFVRQSRFQNLVYDTTYRNNSKEISTYVRLTNFLRLFGFSFTGFFLLIAIIVILNTIRLTIYARRDEIDVMRLVGATRGYIRGPFLVEGVLFGMVGALVAGVLAWGFLRQLQTLLINSFNAQSTNFISDLFNSSLGTITTKSSFNALFTQLFLLQLVAGLALGVVCSYIAVRRYLKD